MRFPRILSTPFQVAIESRAENLVYFLMAFINPAITLLFWNGAFKDSNLISSGWTLSDMTAYYLLIVTAGSMLVAHIEWHVAYEDIYKGYLTQALLKPFSYFLSRLCMELPWRLIQGTLGALMFILFAGVFATSVSFVHDPWMMILAIIISILGFCISFWIKMIVGFSALWTTDYSGLQQLVEVGIIILAGFVLPLGLYPDTIQPLLLHQPFAYIVYFPLLSWMGKVTLEHALQIIGIQCCWMIVLGFAAFGIFQRGIKKYTGVGN